MNKILRTLGILAVVSAAVFFGLRVYTKSHSPAAVAESKNDSLTVRVDYSRPAKKGRVIFGGLVPYGHIWRTGANEATVITFDQDVRVAGQPLAKGAYSLWTMPSPSGWIIVFNTQTGQWGTRYDPTKDRLKVPAPVRQRATVAEQFVIRFAPQPGGTDLTLSWDKTDVIVPIRKP